MGLSWQEVAFGDLLRNGTRNGIYKKKEFHGSGVKIVNMGELFANPRLFSIPMKRVELTLKEKEKFCLEPGDLLFARRSLVAEGAGKCSIVMEIDEPTTFESSIIRARPDSNKLNSLFAYYLFNSPHGKYLLGTILRHVAVAGITGSDLVQLEVPLPPLPEQRAIAHILGSLDDKIELNRRMNRTQESIARAIFKSWFVDFDPVRAKDEGSPTGLPDDVEALFPDSFDDSELGEIPKGWEIGTLNLFSDLNPENWNKFCYPDNILYADLANTKWGRIEKLTIYTREEAPSRAQRVLKIGDTIIGIVRPGNGSYSLIQEDGLTGSTGFAVLRPIATQYIEFVYLAATNPKNIVNLSHLADGAAYPAVRPEVV
jgi:type I restriction enzyme S subunit